MVNTSAQVSYVLPVTTGAGGINRLWWFDPGDVSFTQAGTQPFSVAPYTAVAVSTAAAALTVPVTHPFYEVPFMQESGEYAYPDSQKEGSTATNYAHELSFYLPTNNTTLTAFLNALNVAGFTNGIGFIIEMQNGTFFVIGESLIANVPIHTWRLRKDGSKNGSGKTFSDSNGSQVMIKGNYRREPIQLLVTSYAATLSAVIALQQ